MHEYPRHFVTLPPLSSFPLSLSPVAVPQPIQPSAFPLRARFPLERNFPGVRSTGFRFRFLFCASSGPASPSFASCVPAVRRRDWNGILYPGHPSIHPPRGMFIVPRDAGGAEGSAAPVLRKPAPKTDPGERLSGDRGNPGHPSSLTVIPFACHIYE